MNSLSYFSIIIFIIIILQIVISQYFPNLLLNDYLYSSLFIFFFLYIFTKNIVISLFGTLITFLINTFLHYQKTDYKNPNEYLLLTDTRIFIPFIILLSMIVYHIPEKWFKTINIINMILIFFIIYSILEWFIHKNVMHAHKFNEFYIATKGVPVISNFVDESNKSHITHHIETENDMTLKETHTDKNSLFFQWKVFLPVYILNIIVLFILFILFKIPLPKIHILWISIIIVFTYFLLWNKTHAKMHQQTVDITLKEGPSDYDIIPIQWYLRLIYLNHVKHHLQKGDKKGNYNVVMIGADEWLGTNVKVIDNREYCKFPSSGGQHRESTLSGFCKLPEKKNESICQNDKYQYIPLDKIQELVIRMN